MNERIERVRKYAAKKEKLAKQAEIERNNHTNELIEKVKALKPRIKDLIDLANECLMNGLEIDAYKDSFDRCLDSYEAGTFVSNGISHRVGFIISYHRGECYNGKSYEIKHVGIIAGGAWGDWDFRTDGVNVEAFNENRGTTMIPKDSFLERFLRDFDEFETAFYEYIDRTIAPVFGGPENE